MCVQFYPTQFYPGHLDVLCVVHFNLTQFVPGHVDGLAVIILCECMLVILVTNLAQFFCTAFLVI